MRSKFDPSTTTSRKSAKYRQFALRRTKKIQLSVTISVNKLIFGKGGGVHLVVGRCFLSGDLICVIFLCKDYLPGGRRSFPGEDGSFRLAAARFSSQFAFAKPCSSQSPEIHQHITHAMMIKYILRSQVKLSHIFYCTVFTEPKFIYKGIVQRELKEVEVRFSLLFPKGCNRKKSIDQFQHLNNNCIEIAD
jgi:hypothetical protein